MTFDIGNALLEEERESIRTLLETATIDRLPEIIERLAKVQGESIRAVYISELSKSLRIPRRSIIKDIAAYFGAKPSGKKEENDRIALFPGLVDLVLDNDKVKFLVLNGAGIDIKESHSIEGKVFFPPDKPNLPFTLAQAENVRRYYQYPDKNLFHDIIVFCKRFSYLDDKQWIVLSAYVFLTYLQDHPGIQYLPIILFYAVPERGKSRTGRTLTYLSYRGVHVIDLRESNLFRYSGNLGASLFFDIMDVWRKAELRQSEDILLTRFERGSVVARVIFPERGAFKDTIFYHNFGPTMIATNESIHRILGSRCIPLTMPNSPGLYENVAADAGIELKERLTAWRARHMQTPLPDIEPIDEIQGRLWDISRPLLQVCRVVAPERYDELVSMLVETAHGKLEEKKDSIEGFVVSALNKLSPQGATVPWELSTAAVLEAFNEDRPEKFLKTPQWLGKKLKALGLQTSHDSGRSIISLDRDQLNNLLLQYGFINSITNEDEGCSKFAEHADLEGGLI